MFGVILFIYLLLVTLPQSHSQSSGCPNGANNPISNGDVYSPNYPQDYINNANCIYFLQTTVENVLSIVFDVFSTEECCDHLDIFDGPSVISPLIVKLSGFQNGAQYRSTGQYMTLQFVSDASITRSGFRGHYQSINGNSTVSSSPWFTTTTSTTTTTTPRISTPTITTPTTTTSTIPTTTTSTIITTTTQSDLIYPCKRDILLLIDVSNALSSSLNLQLEVDFLVNSLAASWTISATKAEASICIYGTNVFGCLVGRFNFYSTRDFLAALGTITNYYNQDTTPNITYGFQGAVTTNGQRPGVNQVTILFTSSSGFNDVQSALPYAAQLKTNGSRLIVAGFGPNANIDILGQLASGPEYRFSSQTYSGSQIIADAINRAICY